MNRKNIYYLDLPSVDSIPDGYRMETKDIMRFSGANLGNFAFRKALVNMIEFKDAVVGDYYCLLPLIRSDMFDDAIVVISAANWIGEGEWAEKSNSSRFAVLNQLKCPIVTFGLGAQSPGKHRKLNLGEGTVSLARLLSERSVSISVRDEYTAHVLGDIGVHNSKITGCPSNFINYEKNLGMRIMEKARGYSESASWETIRLMVSEHSRSGQHDSRVFGRSFDMLKKANGFYIIQTHELMPYVFSHDTKFPEYYENIFHANRLSIEDKSLFYKSILHFTSIDGWLDFSRTMDLSAGTRIHGTMLPLQAGTPSMVITHDSRTQGLAESMNIPRMNVDEFLEADLSSPREIYQIITAQMDGYDRRRQELANGFMDFIQENHLNPGPGLSDFIAEAP